MKALPAHPWTIASYLRVVDRRKGIEEVHEAFKAISREHVLKTGRVPTRHATVKSTMDLLERKAEVQDQHGNLFEEEEALVKKSPPPPAPVEDEIENTESQASYLQSVQRRNLLSTKPKMVRRRPK